MKPYWTIKSVVGFMIERDFCIIYLGNFSPTINICDKYLINIMLLASKKLWSEMAIKSVSIERVSCKKIQHGKTDFLLKHVCEQIHRTQLWFPTMNVTGCVVLMYYYEWYFMLYDLKERWWLHITKWTELPSPISQDTHIRLHISCWLIFPLYISFSFVLNNVKSLKNEENKQKESKQK